MRHFLCSCTWCTRMPELAQVEGDFLVGTLEEGKRLQWRQHQERRPLAIWAVSDPNQLDGQR